MLEAFNFCPRCGVTISDKAESDEEHELCYKRDLEVSELAGGWDPWNRNSGPACRSVCLAGAVWFTGKDALSAGPGSRRS